MSDISTAESGISIEPVLPEQSTPAHPEKLHLTDVDKFRKSLGLSISENHELDDRAFTVRQIGRRILSSVSGLLAPDKTPPTETPVPDEQELTTALTIINDLLGGNSKLTPEDAMQNPQRILDQMVILKQFRGEMRGSSTTITSLRLRELMERLENADCLDLLAEHIRQGGEIGYMTRTSLAPFTNSSNLMDSNVDKFVSTIKRKAEADKSPDSLYFAAVREVSELKNNYDTAESVIELTGLFKDFIAKTKKLNTKKKEDLIKYLDDSIERYYYDFHRVADLPLKEQFADFMKKVSSTSTSRVEFHSIYREVTLAMSQILIRKEGKVDGRIFLDLLDSKKSYLEKLTDKLDLTPSQEAFCDFTENYTDDSDSFKPSSHYQLADAYFPDGIPSYRLCSDILQTATPEFAANALSGLIADYPEIISAFPKDQQPFWEFFNSAPDEVLEFLCQHKDSFDLWVINGAVQPEFIRQALAQGCDYRDIMPLISKETLAQLPNEERIVWELFKDAPNSAFNSAFADIVKNPEIMKRLSELISQSDVASFLREFPNLKAVVLDTILELQDNPASTSEQIYEIIASRILARERNIKLFLKGVRFCAKKLGKNPNDLIAEHINEIMATTTTQIFMEKLFSSMEINEERAKRMLLENKHRISFLSLLTQKGFLSDKRFSEEFYKSIFEDPSLTCIPNSDKKLLLEAIIKAGSMEQLLKNKTLLVGIVTNATPEVGKYIVIRWLNWDCSEDSEEYTRENNLSGRVTRNSRGRERQSSEFENQLADLNLTDEQMDEISKTRQFLQTLFTHGNEPIATPAEARLMAAMTKYDEIMKAMRLYYEQGPSPDQTIQEFEIYSKKFDKSRTIPPFTNLWQKKVLEYFEAGMLLQLKQGGNYAETLDSTLTDSLDLYNEGFTLYLKIHSEIIPSLGEMNVLLNEMLFAKGVWFSGRDGIPLYLALKANHFGEPLGTRDKYAEILEKQIEQDVARQKKLITLALEREGLSKLPFVRQKGEYLKKGIDIYLQTQAGLYDILKIAAISRLMFDNMKGKKDSAEIKKYLVSLGITPDMIAVDTGYSGTVIKYALDLLGVKEDNIKGNIRLLSSSDSKISEIGISTEDLSKTADTIEHLPKKYDRSLAIVGGKPVRLQTTLDMQTLNWVVDHAMIRHFAPRRPLIDSNETENRGERTLPESRIEEITTYVRENLPELEEAEKQKLVEITEHLRQVSQVVIAPVIVGFADHLLSELSAKNDLNESLVFAGRDGIGVYQAAQALLTKQPQNYPNVTPSQLAYAYLTRKLVWDTPPEKLKDYMEQLGVTDYAKMTLVDIGMYGTILPELEKALPGFTANNTQYLISRTSAVDGFLDNGGTKKLPVFEQIIGNPVIHFLEDTFSGPIHSPTMLVESDEGILEPDTRDEGYSMDIAIKREFALRGIVDFVSESDLTSLDPEKAGEELNNFLSFPENFRSIMIPHER